MATWSSLVLLSAIAVSALSLPQPDESAYKIPRVGAGRRSQYYVLHSDGTYKYGHDTGEGAFESARLKSAGDLDGEFGYKDPEGQNVRLQYNSGVGGFRAQGDHLPAPHPDFTAAHSAVQSRRPFVDPLADTETDASYTFQFAGDEQSRTEVSDADGNVRGSYTYTDEDGRTRTFSYTAGRGTGFVIEGDDLPQQTDSDATPAATRLTSSSRRFSSSRPAGTTSNRLTSTTSSFRATAGDQRTAPRRPVATQASSSQFGSRVASTSFTGQSAHRRPFGSPKPARRPSAASFGASAQRTPATYSTSISHSPAAPKPSAPRTPSTFSSSASRAPTASRPSTAFSSFSPQTRLSSRPFEEANTRSEVRSDGGYSFAYETSSHSRAESGDRDNNVDGKFDFVAEDDGQRRSVQYEAGSDTGFIAEGAHIPVGPEVPGAPSGQPTGRLVPVKETPFIDPLADTGLDASYNFAFDSEQYSRSETADADGNVQGTYTVVDEDGTRRTFRFRAGKGIGFETEEISVSRGPPPSRAASTAPASSSTSSLGAGSSFSSTSQGSPTGGGVISYKSPSTASRAPVAPRPSTTSSFSSFSSSSSQQASRSPPLRSIFKPTSTKEVFPGFKLHQYDFTKNPDKFGYVLTFDN
ncbi:nuclear pore complex protein DDB_G0274915-like [Penaeus vannamei]|uniref:nuclear pore complex protein DDB_G0274915-like n=1 Tax=Penaeus vannamei TaxID=6689 RepID=UPI00387F59EC